MCCKNPDIYDDNVCHNCGLVIGPVYVSNPKRAYGAEEIKNCRQNEVAWRNFGPRTFFEARDIVYKHYNFRKLLKIQNSLISSEERNLWEALPQMKIFSSLLHIPIFIRETAWKVYLEVVRQHLTKGRSILSFVAASLYAAIRIHEFPCLLDEIVEVAMIPFKRVHRSLTILYRHVLPVLKMKYRPITPSLLVLKIGSSLNVSSEVQNKAISLLSEKKLKIDGKDPRGFAAAALYIAAKSTKEQKTQTVLAKTAMITQVTLRHRTTEILSTS